MIVERSPIDSELNSSSISNFHPSTASHAVTLCFRPLQLFVCPLRAQKWSLKVSLKYIQPSERTHKAPFDHILVYPKIKIHSKSLSSVIQYSISLCKFSQPAVKSGEKLESLGSGDRNVTNHKRTIFIKLQDKLHKRRPHLDLIATRYQRIPDAIESEIKKKQETYEQFQLLSKKQHIIETLEQFHSVLSGLAARCNFWTLEEQFLRDVKIIHVNSCEAQNELCRSTKTPGEVYRIAPSYERGDILAKKYKSTFTEDLPREHFR